MTDTSPRVDELVKAKASFINTHALKFKIQDRYNFCLYGPDRTKNVKEAMMQVINIK